MRKSILFLVSLLTASIVQAQTKICVDSSGDFVPPDCSASGALIVAAGEGVAATFAAMDATATGSIGAGYALGVDLPDDTKVVILDNQTNGDVTVSMDAGTTDHFHVKAGDVISLNLAAAGLETTGIVHLKDGTTASTAGTFYVYSYK